MNVASLHTILAVRRGSSELCKAEPSARSQRGIPVLLKLIGLDEDEKAPLHLTYQLPMPCHKKPLHPLFFLIHKLSRRSFERKES